jgi:ABC-type nitrate/sulfonate/bicarbonate transport system substrate-binding protein/lysophospholipase L1-like esterase
VLAILNVLLIALPLLAPVAPGGDWYKGPLVDPVSPYSAAGGLAMLGFCLAAFLDVSLLLMFAGFALLRRGGVRRPWALPALVLVVSLASFALVEGGLRLYLSMNVKTMFLPDAELNWRLTPGLEDFHNLVGGEVVNTNVLGWRAPQPRKSRATNEMRGLVLGDSSAYGLGVAEDKTMAVALQRRLAAALPDKDVTVFNAACPGHTTHQGLKLLQRYAPGLGPDLVVVAYNNDPAPEFFTDREREAAAGALKPLQVALYRSRLFIILRQVVVGWWRGEALDWEDPSEVHRRAVDGKQMKPRVPLDEFRDNLQQMAALARERGFKLVFVRMPVNLKITKFVERFVDERYPQALAEVAAEIDATLVDVNAKWTASGTQDFVPGHLFHPDAAGHARIAAQMLSALRESGFVPADAPEMPTPLRFGYSSITPLHTLIGEVLRRTDLAARRGFAASFAAFERGSDQAEAAGELDATFTTEVPAIAFLEAHPEWRVVGCTGRLGVVAVVARNASVGGLGELRGKRVGVALESTAHADLAHWLAGAGLRPGAGVTLAEVGLREQETALAAGRVDALATWDPWVTDLVRLGYRPLIERRFFSLMILQSAYLADHPDVAERYRALVADALAYARDHRDQVEAWVGERSDIDAATLRLVLAASGPSDGDALDFAVPDEALAALRRDFAFLRNVPEEDVSGHPDWRRLMDQFVGD